ncbi:MAG: hypothetical protein K8F25_03480 [Fimbriimonadaceae bacterium]|nr:hypothetical protein [Alphaproteobacteria bacterium]
MITLRKLLKSKIHYVVAASLLLSLGAVDVKAEDQRVALEVVAIKLKAGGDMDAFRKSDKAVAELISKQPGFISRETGSGPDGEWFTIVHWASLKDAENAAGVFMQSEQGKMSLSLVDQNSVFFKHYVTQP